ncbi:MAG: flagellar biosynthetic protein FliR [Nitrospirota bacterium]
MDAVADLVKVIWENQLTFLFILTRIASFVAALPLLGGGGTPVYVKALLAVGMTFVMFPVVSRQFPPPSPTPPEQISLGLVVQGLLSEITIGMVIGFGARIIFAAVELGAEVAGMQIGFGVANAFDPISNQQVSLMRQIYMAIAALIFLAIYGDHVVLRAMALSFEVVPASGFTIKGPLIEQIIRMGSNIFILGMKIAAPITVALLLAQIAMGVISRVVPQIQVFMFSFPLTIGIGLIVFGLSMSLYVSLLKEQMGGQMERHLADLLMRMKAS